ncbi:hypothetical protein I308_106574 [Cryptococcus tetragattii IND107]|uniref:Caffeine-induced death protein 2 n=1 Tax=Cryptococcus tetragattii IND107 TaxID=1296105 RepID=A0ABR3BHY1_9TREE|nr:hypothetical protein I308_06486 [Cryptococcus tetragattii IND107]
MPAPPFGTASAYTDSFPAPPPKQVTVTAETCFNLGVFRDIVRQYRKLDDQIIIRLNRAQAELRDRARTSNEGSWISGGVKSMEGAEGMCVKMWSEMMAGWAHRQTLLTFCSQTVQSSVEGKRNEGAHVRGIREEEVLADQLASEESIEAIIRKRTLEAFKSRCPFFMPSDNTSKAWYNLADRGLKGHGPDLP